MNARSQMRLRRHRFLVGTTFSLAYIVASSSWLCLAVPDRAPRAVCGYVTYRVASYSVAADHVLASTYTPPSEPVYASSPAVVSQVPEPTSLLLMAPALLLLQRRRGRAPV
jgi:hypothetical protein